MPNLAREQSHPEVYLISGTQKFWIPTPDALFGMGYDWSAVQVVPDGSLANLTTITAESLAATPPSLVYPPDNNGKWCTLITPISKQVVSCGQVVSLTELRGWLRIICSGCNTEDADWQYQLELDPEWCDAVGLDMNQLIKVGNITETCAYYDPVSTPYAKVGIPCIHVELNGWPDIHHPKLNWRPSDWTVTVPTDTGCPQIIRPFQPLQPDGIALPISPLGAPLLDPLLVPPNPQAAPYVKLAGSLVTDEPHTGYDKLHTYLALVFNIFDPTTGAEESAARLAWDTVHTTGDPANVARWTEMHPPDGIWHLSGSEVPTYKYEQRAVAVLARSGLLEGEQQALDVDISPPGPRPAGMQAAVIESVGPETDFATIIEGNAAKNGAQITSYGDHIHIHVKVQGRAVWGPPGKFKALYRVYWVESPPPPKGKEHKEKDKDKEKEKDGREKPHDSPLIVQPQSFPPGSQEPTTQTSGDGQAFIQPQERPPVGQHPLQETGE